MAREVLCCLFSGAQECLDTGCRQVPTADSALSSATALQRDAMRLALDDFVAVLKQQAAVPAAPAWGGSTTGSLSPTAGYTPRQGAPFMTVALAAGIPREPQKLPRRPCAWRDSLRMTAVCNAASTTWSICSASMHCSCMYDDVGLLQVGSWSLMRTKCRW